MQINLFRIPVLVVLIIVLFNACSCKTSSKKKSNKTKTMTECEIKCNMRPNSGSCKAYFPRYYFDKETGKCTEFIWGGCEGAVPFLTLEECEVCDCNKEIFKE